MALNVTQYLICQTVLPTADHPFVCKSAARAGRKALVNLDIEGEEETDEKKSNKENNYLAEFAKGKKYAVISG